MNIQELAKTLQQEGVAKGKSEAEKIVADAKKQAEEIVTDAKKQQQDIIAQGKSEADKLLASGKENLALAARDTLLNLRGEIETIFAKFLATGLNKELSSTDTIKPLLQTLVDQYAKQTGSHQVKVELSEDNRNNLESWLKQELKVETESKKGLAGFRIQDADGGKVEVAADSVQEAILPFLSGLAKDLVAQEK